MHDRLLLLKHPHDLDERETLTRYMWVGTFTQLAVTYHLKEDFYLIYEASTEEALHRHVAWFEHITPDVADAFLPFTLAIERYGDAIFHYFSHRYTAECTKSPKELMKLTQRIRRRDSFEAIHAKALLTNGVRKTSRPGYSKQWHRTTLSTHTTFPLISDTADRTPFA